MVNKIENTSEKHFGLKVKYCGTAATDVDFDVDLIESTRTVEVTPNPPVIDSWLLTALAKDALAAKRGIDTIVWQRNDWCESIPRWKLVLIIGGERYAVRIVEVFSLSNAREFTVIFSPLAISGAI
ncbi:MAG: hypothetical protein ACYC4K_03565 [Thiobacillus sp.]